MPDASVVCRMLGFPGAWTAGCCTKQSGGRDPIWLSDLSCTGQENTLSECKHSGWGVHDCDHTQDAEVICHSPATEKPTKRPLRISTSPASEVKMVPGSSYEIVVPSVVSPSSPSLTVMQSSTTPTSPPGMSALHFSLSSVFIF